MKHFEFEKVKFIFEENGKTISFSQYEKLKTFVDNLIEVNQSVNLISRKYLENIWENHIFHSISPFFVFDFKNCGKLVDIGTGGGFPGIPLKIILEEKEFLLIDSIKKKIDATNNFISNLQLKKINTFNERSEILSANKLFTNKYDIVISRAVSSIENLILWSKGFLKQDGKFIFLKGGNLDEEIFFAKRKFKNIEIQVIDLKIKQLEFLEIGEKKLVIVNFL